MATLVAAAALVCAAHFLNPHPHEIRDSDDAITTALDNWDATFPDVAASSPRDREFHKSIYTAQREAGLWHLIPHPIGARYPGQGTHIWIDGKTGCITKGISFD